MIDAQTKCATLEHVLKIFSLYFS